MCFLLKDILNDIELFEMNIINASRHNVNLSVRLFAQETVQKDLLLEKRRFAGVSRQYA